MNAAQQHDVDFYSWTQEQAAILRTLSRESNLLDIDNLAEEIEDMGRAEINAISSLLNQTLAHLIKIAIDPEAQSASHWFNEIITFQSNAVLTFSPGLRQRLDLQKIWKVASNGAIRSLERFGVAIPVLPESCPLTLDQLLDSEFDPDSAVRTITSAIQQSNSNDCGRR